VPGFRSGATADRLGSVVIAVKTELFDYGGGGAARVVRAPAAAMTASPIASSHPEWICLLLALTGMGLAVRAEAGVVLPMVWLGGEDVSVGLLFGVRGEL